MANDDHRIHDAIESIVTQEMPQSLPGALDNVSIVSDDDNISVSSAGTHSSSEDTRDSIFRKQEQIAEENNDENSQRSEYSNLIQRLRRSQSNDSSPYNQNVLAWLENELQQIQLEFQNSGTTDDESHATEDPESGEKELSALMDSSVVSDLQNEIFDEEHPFVTAVSSPMSEDKGVIYQSHKNIDVETQKRFDLAVESLFSERLHLKRLHVTDELTGQSQDFDEKKQIEDDRKKRYIARLKNVVVVAAASSAVVGFILGNITVTLLPLPRLRGGQIHVSPSTNYENDLKFRINELERRLKESSKNISTAESETAKIRKTLYNSEQKATQLEETLEQAAQSHNAASKSTQEEIKQLTESINKLKMEHKEESLRLKTALDERRLTMVQMDELKTRYKEANEKLAAAESENSQLRGQQRKVNGHLAIIEMSLERETAGKQLLQSRTERLQQQLRVSLDKITELEQNRDAIHLDLGEKSIALQVAQKEVQKLRQAVKEKEKRRLDFSTQHLPATVAEIKPSTNEDLRKLQQQFHLSWKDLHTWGVQGMEKTGRGSSKQHPQTAAAEMKPSTSEDLRKVQQQLHLSWKDLHTWGVPGVEKSPGESSKQHLRSTVAETNPNAIEEQLHLSWKNLHTWGVQLPN